MAATFNQEELKAGLSAIGVAWDGDNVFRFMGGVTEAKIASVTHLKNMAEDEVEKKGIALENARKEMRRAQAAKGVATRAVQEAEQRATLFETESRTLREENEAIKAKLRFKDESLWKALDLSMAEQRSLLGVHDAPKGPPTREEKKRATVDVMNLFYRQFLEKAGLTE